uniref:hypothetical protein n=1 Tax=Peribacillus saganii TaxID=2303992 RepID=UPI001F229CE4|nr:hypothetical protein [Peribacillus saganii]
METHYVFRPDYEVNEQVVKQEKCRASRFVLASTLPVEWQEQTMDGFKLLAMYNGQIHVEMYFTFLKDPFYTDEIYLKNPERIPVISYLFLLSLAIYSVIQRRIRQFITAEKPIKGAGGRKFTKPTAQVIFQLFQYLQVVVFQLPDGTIPRHFVKPLTHNQQRVF